MLNSVKHTLIPKKAVSDPRLKVVATGGKLSDTVVFIEKIDGGKPWGDFGKAAYDFKLCDITQKVLAVRKPTKAEKKTGGILMVTNQDGRHFA